MGRRLCEMGLRPQLTIKSTNMDIKEIQSLIKFVAKSGASEVKLEMEDVKITIRTGEAGNKGETTYIQQVPAMAAAPTAAAPAPAAAAPGAPLAGQLLRVPLQR